jgi:hypothetical protein
MGMSVRRGRSIARLCVEMYQKDDMKYLVERAVEKLLL